MPAIYISKYNRFVDNIITRISRILGKSYDPVRVKLQSPSQVNKAKNKSKSNNKNGNNKQKKVKGPNNNKNTNNKQRRKPQRKQVEAKNKMGELSLARSNEEENDTVRLIESESREPAFILISKTGTGHDILKNITVTTTEIKTPANSDANTSDDNNNGVVEVRQSSNKKKKNTIRTGNTASKNKVKKNKQNNNNNKKTTKKNKQKAKATLFGLSTLKRDGNVIVNMMADHTMVKSNFVLGPLTLRVEREVDNKGRRELKSATATTAEMYGRLNLKIIHGGAATLHSLRVLQPKQVRVDSPDDHDKTREFIWKRSAHIASMVSQKLALAARSMLQPPMGK